MAMVHSKSAITPLRNGRITSMVPGARPNMRLASSPTASTRSLPFIRLTTDGSRMTTPRPRSATSVLAVPRSIAKSLDKRLLSFLMSKVYSLLLVRCLLTSVPSWGVTRPSRLLGPCAPHAKATYLTIYIVTPLLYRKSSAPPMIFCNLTAALDPSTKSLCQETTSYNPLQHDAGRHTHGRSFIQAARL